MTTQDKITHLKQLLRLMEGAWGSFMCPTLTYIQRNCSFITDKVLFSDEDKTELIAELWKDRLIVNLYITASYYIDPYEGPWYELENDYRITNVNATIKRLEKTLEVSI